MTRKLVFVGVLMLAMSCVAMAQDFPKFEVFGGYSYMRSDLNYDSSVPYYEDYYYQATNGKSGNLNGFELSFSYNLNSWLGIKADFSGHYGDHDLNSSSVYEYTDYEDYYGEGEYYYTDKETYKQTGTVEVQRYTYLFGPEFSYRGSSKIRPFAHALFGFSSADLKNINVDWTNLDQYSYYEGSSTDYFYEGNVTGSFSNTGFAMALGGGLDINVNDKFAIRVAQLDYLGTYHEFKGDITQQENRYYGTDSSGEVYDSWERTQTTKVPSQKYNNIRYSAGVVFKF